jgi:hypothetical protein
MNDDSPKPAQPSPMPAQPRPGVLPLEKRGGDSKPKEKT